VSTRVVILGAGFGGLELSSRLSAKLGDTVEVTLIDRAEAFVFGFSKLDLMFGARTADEIRVPYSDLATPHVRFRQETITAIDPDARLVMTDLGSYEADILVVALGADYDVDATPGLRERGNEFYSVDGAAALREMIPSFRGGSALVGVCGSPFKCPPAPSEAALLLDQYLREHGGRDQVTISVAIPFHIPIPPSPATSEAILERFAERGIAYLADNRVTALEDGEAVLNDGSRVSFDLFLGIPVHRAPRVVVDAGLTVDGWVPVDQRTLATSFPGVYAVGDVTSVGTPKAGVFSQDQAAALADHLVARLREEEEPHGYDGTGSCYVELGGGEVAKVDVDFFSTPGRPTGTYIEPSPQTAAEKASFAADRIPRWFGLAPTPETSDG
jgi:sulfide:quinone oxidoreductase